MLIALLNQPIFSSPLLVPLGFALMAGSAIGGAVTHAYHTIFKKK